MKSHQDPISQYYPTKVTLSALVCHLFPAHGRSPGYNVDGSACDAMRKCPPEVQATSCVEVDVVVIGHLVSNKLT